MARMAMVIDLRRCVGCKACTVSCGAEWDVPPSVSRTHVHSTPVVGTFPALTSSFHVAQCNHCDDAPCLDACPTGATTRNAEGVVVVDHGLCIGCGYCASACPYDARFLHPVTQRIDKCDFCATRTARGQLPACVTTCTAHAKYFGDLENPESEVARLVFTKGARRVESPDVTVGPNVYYLGSPAQVDLVTATFPPRQPRLPDSGQALASAVKPLVLTAVAATFVGQAVAFFAQLWKGEDDDE